jgi:two-component system response regulator YesN
VSGGIEQDVRREAALYAGWILKNRDVSFAEAGMKLAELYLLAKRMVQEQGSECPGGQEQMRLLLTAENDGELRQRFVAATAELARMVVIQNQESDGIITQAQEYIRQNFRRDFSLEEAAQAVGISPYYFSKLFKEKTGVNFTEYLTGLRIETAKQLLLNPKLSIKQVCIDSGYSNPNYFSRIFKKWTGITPTEFRDGIQEVS